MRTQNAHDYEQNSRVAFRWVRSRKLWIFGINRIPHPTFKDHIWTYVDFGPFSFTVRPKANAF